MKIMKFNKDRKYFNKKMISKDRKYIIQKKA